MAKNYVKSRKEHLSFSLELFPPKTDRGRESLLGQIPLVESIKPRTLSVTSGAGGTGNNRTLSTIKAIKEKTDVPLTAHVTCIADDKVDTQHSLDEYTDEGIYNILALRGDPNESEPDSPAIDSYGSAAALVRGIRSRSDGDQFYISVAGYPEVHPKAQSKKTDLESLKTKVAEGADLIITQFFFDPLIFLKFLEETEESGINAPIVPGIIVISDFSRIANFAAKCGTHIPDWIAGRFAGIEPGSEEANSLAEEITTQQCSQLMEHGIRMFHFYTLNRLDLVVPICEKLLGGYSSQSKSDCTNS